MFFLADYFTYHNQPSREENKLIVMNHLTGLYTFLSLVVRILGFSCAAVAFPFA